MVLTIANSYQKLVSMISRTINGRMHASKLNSYRASKGQQLSNCGDGWSLGADGDSWSSDDTYDDQYLDIDDDDQSLGIQVEDGSTFRRSYMTSFKFEVDIHCPAWFLV